jgi:hypothetical protein
MKILAFLVLLFAISNISIAQENYIIAGQVDSNYVYHDIIPDEWIVANVTMGEGETKYYYLDLNSDNIDDFKFIITNNGGQGGWTKAVLIEPLDQNSIALSHYHAVPTDTIECSGDTLYFGVAKKYYIGDTISYNSNFVSTTLSLNKDSWVYLCYDYEINEWIDPELLYVGLSVYTDNIQTLGWVRVHSVGMSSISIDSYYYNKRSEVAILEYKSDPFQIYPNPSHDYVNINPVANTAIEKIEIFDVNGQNYTIPTYFENSELRINIASLPRGLYFIKLFSDDNVYVNEFVKK